MDLRQTARYTLILLFIVSGLSAEQRTWLVDMTGPLRYEGLVDFLPDPVQICHVDIRADASSTFLFGKVVPPHPFLLDQHLLQKIILHAAHTNCFTDLEFKLDNVTLQIIPHKAWLFDRVTINGFMFGKDIFKRLYLMQAGDHFDHKKHKASCQAILNYLRDNGYFEAKIADHITYNQERMAVSAKFTIEHGDQYVIDYVKITGAQAVEHWSLQSLVNKPYRKELVDAQCAHFKRNLIRHGYFPQIFVIKISRIPGTKKVALTLDLALSEQRKFIFYGNHYLHDEQLLEAIVVLGKSAWIIPVDMLADVLVQEYHRHGFDKAHVAVKAQAVGSVFHIQEGEPTQPISQPFTLPSMPATTATHKKFGATILQNLSTIPHHYIEREILYDENEAWNSEAVSQTIKNLNRLQVFDEVSLINIFDPSDPERSTMLLKVHNDLPYELRLKGGIGLQQMSKDFIFKGVSYVAGGTFLIKNPFNRADLLSVDADYTHGEHNLAIRYTYPWLFNFRMHTYMEIYVDQYLQPGLHHNHKNIYSFVQHGFLVGAHYEHGPFDSQCNVGLEWMKTQLVDKHNPFLHQQLVQALYFEPVLVDKKIPYVVLEPQLAINTTDDKLNPCRGNVSLVQCKGMFPWRSLSFNSFFVKMLLDHSWYTSINAMVLAVRTRVGHIFYKDFKNVMPAERFYLGGANSIRSYETDMCPPLGTITNEKGKTYFVPQGTRSMITFNAELRIPAYRGLWIALFQDIGALSNNHFTDIKARDILAGTGLGIRYQTPIGPLRFDVAFKWHRPDPRISRYCWFLSFGNAF